MVANPLLLSLSEQARLIREGSITSVELVQAHLDQISKLNPQLNSLIAVDPESALEQAAEIDAARDRGEDLGPLAGVTLGVKDAVPVKGMPWTINSRIFEHRVPEYDAPAITRLKKAGAIIIGKANLNEFFSRPTESDLNPPPWNPWNPERMSVGSSSGSGAALAARMASGTIGVDGGGSVRLPAGAHNLYGIKPTHGLVSRIGVGRSEHSEICPLGFTALDTAMMLEAMVGYEPADDLSWPGDVPEYAANIDTDISGWRIGVPRGFIDSVPNESEVIKGFEDFLKKLEALGCELIEFDIQGMAEARAATFLTLFSNSYQRHQKTVKEDWDTYGPQSRVNLLQGAFMSSTDLINAGDVGRAFKAYFSKKLADLSLKAVATPTSPFATAERSRRPDEHSRGINACYTAPFNISGHPSISVPAGFGEAGIPVGAMLTGETHDDLSLLQLAHAYDKATDYATLSPSI
ncbi:MAG: amidase [Chloroflexi bacterium]|jgi:aspartyl-tRNA(Asn)/glutamyl-tRNA(Gln) amidotransferase subunit A|nr:amidase [Chloroflexota bacterium]